MRVAVPEIKRMDAIPVFGDYDEDGNWVKYEYPQYNLIVEAVGTGGMVHAVQSRISFDSFTKGEVRHQFWLMLERVLENRMKDMGVWDAES